MIPDSGAPTAADLSTRPRQGAAGVTTGIVLDGSTRCATVPDGAQIVLTPLEFAVLEYLLTRAGRTCSRAAIMCEALGYARPVGSRTVDMHVASLRTKLGPAVEIRTVHGIGYVLSLPDPPGRPGGNDVSR